MAMKVNPNDTYRQFLQAGYLISEVKFLIEDVGWFIGYMVGHDDGRSVLAENPADAVAAYRRKALVPVAGGSPYGLLTRRMVLSYLDHLKGFQAGWETARITSSARCPGCGYADLRDELLGYVDIPYELACLIALYVARPNDAFFLSFTVVF